jgi:hypothetical protein
VLFGSSHIFNWFNGGLGSILLIIGVCCFAWVMIAVGFISGDTSVAQIGNFITLAFTGE